MKTRCAWCGAHVSGPADAMVTSHGICPECDRGFRAAAGIPVITIDREDALSAARHAELTSAGRSA